jgi:hypothetical protein
VEPDTHPDKVWERKQRLTEATGVYRGNDAGLGSKVQLSAWPTPTTRDWKDGSPNENVPVNALLGREVWAAGWPTLMAGTPAQKDYNEAGNNDSSRKTVALAGWGTPTAQAFEGSPEAALERKKGHPCGQVVTCLSHQVKMIGPARLTASGEMLTGSAAQMESGGQLHPEHSLWLQLGPFAAAWARCAERVMPSTWRKQRRSSKL